MFKKYRIKKVSNIPNTFQYLVEQRCFFLGIPICWDGGAWDLKPNYYFMTKEEALNAIAELVTDTSLIENCCKNE